MKTSKHSNTSHNDTYRQTLLQTRKELPRAKRPFSMFVHAPAIEQISDMLALTLFRPNALLAGSVLSFVTGVAVYAYAKYAGFTLQGSEMVVAFAIGWVIGTLFDVAKHFLTRR